MDEKEHKAMIDGIYPVGQERWVKVKYLDQNKAMKAFPWNGGKTSDELGYEVVALGVKDEFIPQVAALIDVRDNLLAWINATVTDESSRNQLLGEVNGRFNMKLDELKQYTIKTE